MSYKLFPFRFKRFNDSEIFLSNEVGEFVFVENEEFNKLVSHQLSPQTETFLTLKSKQILTDSEVDPPLEMLAIKYRTKKNNLNYFTSLHMVVPTLRCNSNCIYCQVSRKDIDTKEYDMNKNTAKKIVDIIFMSPSPFIKIEFQGGEPLLNFNIVKYIIDYSKWVNKFKRKNLEFVICTNLSLMDRPILKYLQKNKIYISTSLDGPKDLHNKNRPLRSNSSSYDILTEKLNLCRDYIGQDNISALMTSSSYSLGRFIEIIDEYTKQGFHSIFLRSLNPYGFAKRDKDKIGYRIDKFITSYCEALDYIIDINLKGVYFCEIFATLLLIKILTPFSTGFVDMQSPAGVGIGGVIYNYDGNVYVSDEARMFASMGDQTFLMGNVYKNSYQELFNSEFLRSLIKSSCLECLPECARCAYQTYCGADPVRNYSEQGDIIGKRQSSEECTRNKEIITYILKLLKKDDKSINSIFWSWINRKKI